MLGGGGSVQNMITTLKSNKKLLNRRNYLFKRNSSYNKSLRQKYYKAYKGIVDERKPSKAEIDAIRQKVIAEQKKEFVIRISITSVIFIALIVCVFVVAKNNQAKYLEAEKIKKEKLANESVLSYRKSMDNGLKAIQKKQWFFAVGHYENALRFSPNNAEAEYNLVFALCSLCYYENSSCQKANEIISEMIEKNKNPERYLALKEMYLDAE